MPLLLALGLMITAAPAAGRPSVVVVGLHAVELPQKTVDAFAELFADELATTTPQVKVTSSEALANLLGLERQRQLLGCSSDSTCMTEIVGALGPAALVSGSMVKIGEKISVAIRLLGGSDGRLIYGKQATVSGQDAAIEWLKDQAAVVGKRVVQEYTVAAPAGPPPRVGPIVTTVVAGVGLASAITFFVLAGAQHTAFLGAGSLSEAKGFAATGTTYQLIAWSSAGVAIAAAIASTVLFALPHETTASLIVVPGGGALTFGGTF